MRVTCVLVASLLAWGCVSSQTKQEIASLESEIQRLEYESQQNQEFMRLARVAEEEAKRDLENAMAQSAPAEELNQVRDRWAFAQAEAKRKQDEIALSKESLTKLQGELKKATEKAKQERDESWGSFMETIAPLAALIPVVGVSASSSIGAFGARLRSKSA